MDREFIPHEQAITLKELGFDKPCFGYYFYNGSFNKWTLNIDNEQSEYLKTISAPTFSQAFRWFRKKHNLSSWIYNSNMNEFFYTILQNGRIVKAQRSFLTYEEAELACLVKLIELVKNK